MVVGPAATKYGPQVGLVDPSVKLTVMGEKTVEATAKKIRDALTNAIQVQKIPKGQWISVSVRENKDNPSGTNRSWLYLGKINRRHVDSVTPDHPVMVVGRSAGFFNSKAVADFKGVFADWDESTDMENRSGAAKDGYLAVPEMGGITFEYWWKDKPLSDLAEAMRLGGLDVLKRGFTTVATRILYPRAIAAYSLLNREAKMPFRLAYYIESQRGNFFSIKSTREFYKGMGAPWTTHASGNEMMWLNGMCNEIWDSTQNEICMGPDVPASSEVKARERCPSPGTRPWETVKAGVLTGWRPAQIHGTSSHGARLYIQMLDQARKEGNFSVEYIKALRPTLEHNFLLGNVPDVIAGIQRYGIILNVKLRHMVEVPPLFVDYGDQLRPYAMPVKTWLKEGIRVTMESEGTDPWTPIYSLVTREMPMSMSEPRSKEWVTFPAEEAIDRVTALKMITTWGSEYVFGENTLGTLEPGKYADFTVLDKDYFTIPVKEIIGLKAVMTGLNGKIVYQRKPGETDSGSGQGME